MFKYKIFEATAPGLTERRGGTPSLPLDTDHESSIEGELAIECGLANFSLLLIMKLYSSKLVANIAAFSVPDTSSSCCVL